MKRNLKKALALLLAMTMLFSMGIQAFAAPASEPTTRLYVKASEGDDSNPGSEDSPFLTLGKAVQAAPDRAEIVLLSDIPLSKELVIEGRKSLSITSVDPEAPNTIQFVGADGIGTQSGLIKAVGGVELTLHDIAIAGSTGKVEGRVIYVDESTVTLRDTIVRSGRVNTVSPYAGGAGIHVERGKVILEDGVKITGNETVGNGGGIYVANGGSLTVNGGDIVVSNNRAANGGGIYLCTQSSPENKTRLTGGSMLTSVGLVFSSNEATTNGGAMYVEKDANAAVAGEVTAFEHKVGGKANNIYLAKDATLDISDATLFSMLGITAADEYAYRLIANQEDGYEIKTSPANQADEVFWEDDCGAWDIRYLNHNGVPGLYLVYHTINAVFEDVRTLTSVKGDDLNGDETNYMDKTVPNTTIENGVMTVPSIVMKSNDQSSIKDDLVFTITCDENYRIPTEDVVKVTCDGKDVPFAYTPDFNNGVANITIARDVVDNLPDFDLHLIVSAEKYHLLTIQANGPLYALATDITGRETTSLTVTGSKDGEMASYTVSRNGSGVANVKVELLEEGTTTVVASATTDERGIATFNGLKVDSAYFPILKYSDAFKVIERDTVTVTLSAMEGQELAETATATAGDMSYNAADAMATITGIDADCTATFSVKQNLDTITFHGNEGEATTKPATITMDGASAKGTFTKDMEAANVTVGKLPTAEMVGYTFKGWFATPECDGEEILSSTAYSKGAYPDLYAKWTPSDTTHYVIEHWVEYAEAPAAYNVGKNGDVVDGYYLYDSIGYDNGTSDAVKDISGMDLKEMTSEEVSWWTRQGFTAHVQEAPCKVLADGSSVFKIFYTRNEYNVTFKVPLTAGTAVNHEKIPAQTAKFGDVYGTLPDPKLPGYNYNEDMGVWYDGDNLVTRTTPYTKTTDTELVARWNANTDTKWAIKIATRDMMTNEKGEKVLADTYTEYKTVYKTINSEGVAQLLEGQSDTTITKTVADIPELGVIGFHLTGYAAEYSATGEGMTADDKTFTVYVKPTDATTEKNGEYNEAFDGSVVWLYYDRNTVKVEFVDDNGNKTTEDEITFGGDFTGHLPPAPGKDGYDFDGWVDPDNKPIKDDTEADEYVKDGKDLIVHPTWTARDYLLTYVPGPKAQFVAAKGTEGKVKKSDKVAGGYINPTKVTYDQPFGTLPSASKVGYNFIEWKTNEGVAINEEMTVTVNNVVISNAPVYNYEDTRPLYAQYVPHTYTLVLDPGETKSGVEGTVTPGTVEVTFDAKIDGMPVPVLPGYKFVEWRLDVDDPDSVVKNGNIWDKEGYTDKAKIPVYAIWVPETFRYNFDKNDEIGSTRASLVDTTIDYTEETFDSVYNGVVSVEATRPGYHFDGWSLTKDGEVLTTETMNITPEDTTVYAIWTPLTYPVRMEMKGGKIADLTDNSDLDIYDPTAKYDAETDTWTVTVTFDTVYGELPVATKTDCVFRGYKVNAPGWPTTEAFGKTIHGEIITALPQYLDYVDKDGITLTAVLEPYFTFDPDGGKFVEDDSTDPKKELQSEITEMPKVEKDGYEQEGWIDSKGNPVDLDDVKNKTEPEVLKPKYVAKVTLDANGGTVNDKPTDTVALRADMEKFPDPIRSGYIFDGWYTERDGGEKVDIAKLKADNAPVTIYAHWRVRSSGGGGGGGISYYTVTFESNGGSKVPSQSVSYGQKAKKPENPTKEFHVFTGWFEDKELKQPFDFDKTTIRKSITLYAGWEYRGPFAYLTDEHIAYIVGRDDGLVHPEANITRAEVATIFYRLLKDDVRAQNRKTVCAFTDVEKGAWYATAVSTLANMGIIKGRGNNTFDPNAEITRAEFAVICARFDTMDTSKPSAFPDVPASYWAYSEIGSAAAKGWVKGRDDGTFGPDLRITRAEVVTLLNRVLDRDTITVESIVTTDTMKTWPDNMDTETWFYLPMQEATNAHTHKMVKDVEHWQTLKPIKVAE